MKHIVNRIFLFHLFFVSQGLFAQSEQIDSLKQLYANETVDTIKINLSLKIATAYKSTSPDIAFEYINQARQDGLEVDSLNWYSQINQATANIYQHLGEFDHALEYYYKNKFYLDHKKTDTIEDLIIYRRIMNSNNLFLCYNDLGKSQDALDHIFEAIDLLNELKQRNSEHYSTRRYLIILNNLATVYINENEYPKAKQTFLQALELSQNIDDKYFIAIISNNLGIIHMNLKEYDYASLYYKKAEETWIKLKDTSRLIQVYNNLGSYYSMLEDNNKAITYLNKALVLSENQKVYRSAIITVQSLATIYSKNNEFEKALDYHKKFKSLSDSLFNQETSKNIARTEFEYEFLKKQRDKEIEQQKELALKEKRILQIKMFSGITFLIFISGALLFFILRNKNKHSRLKQNHLELEGKHLKLAKENLKHEIQGKNKELTTNVLYLVKKNEFISNIAERLLIHKTKFTKENQSSIRELIGELQRNAETQVWEEFEIRFQQVHNDFYENLNGKFPNLTPNERKLCAFLKLNMSTKEISAITFQTTNSITVARSRLRKKLGIDREENLVAFLNQF